MENNDNTKNCRLQLCSTEFHEILSRDATTDYSQHIGKVWMACCLKISLQRYKFILKPMT